MKIFIILWSMLFLTVSSVPRCGAVGELLRFFSESGEAEVDSCHDTQETDSKEASISDAGSHCQCLVHNFLKHYQIPFSPVLTASVVRKPLPIQTQFINVFRLTVFATVESPPPRSFA